MLPPIRRLAVPAVRLILALAAACALPAIARAQSEPIVVSIDSIRVVEGDSDTTRADFTVTFSRPAGRELRVDWVTVAGSAVADTDFVADSGQVVFTSQHVALPLQVRVLGDREVEGNDVFRVRLSTTDPEAVVADSIGLCTIVNDERTSFRHGQAGLFQFPLGVVGQAFADFDRDGDQDLTLDINLGRGLFEANYSVVQAMPSQSHHGAAWCDYDRDGWPDLVVVPYTEGAETTVTMHLFHNRQDGTFEDVAPARGMAVSGCGETAVWGDFDGDRWPDLFVPYYAYLPPGRSFLYRNLQDGTFIDIAGPAGVALVGLPEALKPEGACAVDWNGDGTLDLYTASHLWLNDGAAHFTDVRAAVGLPEAFDEGATFMDEDNDGDFDFYLRTYLGAQVFRNEGGLFREVTTEIGLAPTGMLWGDAWVDVDNDGDLDLLLMPFPPPMRLYLNQGDGRLVEDPTFAAENLDNVVSAWADVDGDGDLDGALGTSNRQMLFNRADQLSGARDAVLRVEVVDEDSMHVCFGTTVRLTRLDGAPHAIQSRIVDGGGGTYLSQSEYTVQFGGFRDGAFALQVDYPGGPQTWTRVDSTTVPLLGHLVPGELPSRRLVVFRDGRIAWHLPEAPTPVAAPPPGPATPSALGAPWPVPARTIAHVAVRTGGPHADLTVHDVSGRCVRRLATGGAAGATCTWDLHDERGRRVPGGIYFLRLAVDGRVAGERRIVVLR